MARGKNQEHQRQQHRDGKNQITTEVGQLAGEVNAPMVDNRHERGDEDNKDRLGDKAPRSHYRRAGVTICRMHP